MRILSAISFLLLFASICQGQAPLSCLEISPGQRIDAGPTVAGEAKQFDWQIKNTSTDTVRIKNVKSSSGNVIASWGQEAMAPGESSWIRAKLDTRNHVGRIQRSLIVNLESPRESGHLFLSADLYHAEGSLPCDSVIDLGDIRPPQKVEVRLRVPEIYPEPFYVVDIQKEGGNRTDLFPGLGFAEICLHPGQEAVLTLDFQRDPIAKIDWKLGPGEVSYSLKFSGKSIFYAGPRGESTLDFKWNIIE